MIIGILGKKRSGKDTICKFLVENYEFHKLAFADPIKDVARELFNLNDEQLNGIKKEEKMKDYNISPRQFFQVFGTDIMQDAIYNYIPELEDKIPKKLFWTINIFNKIKHLETTGMTNFCISDVRFVHEVDYILEKGGIIIKVNRNTENDDNHISETEINDIDDSKINYRVDNNGTIGELNSKIKKIVDRLIIL